jgi:hypothetical protein
MYSRRSCFCFSKEITGTWATPKMALGSCPSENSFCNSETIRRRMAPRTNLFVPVRRLHKKVTSLKEISWVQVPVKMFSVP